MNSYLKRIQERGNQHGIDSEKRIAKKLGARLTPGSGAKRGAKGDSSLSTDSHKFLIESKSTVNASISLDLGWLVKIAHEAMDKAHAPVLTISFVHPDGKARTHGDWVAVPLWLAQELFLGD